MLYYQRGKIPAYVVIFSAVVTLALLFSTMVGWVNNAEFSFIFEDIKPLSYFYCIIFFSFYIDSIQKVNWIVSLIKKTSLFMALVYIFIQILFYFGKIDFLAFYDYVNNQISKSDFFFRGTKGLFFYKGFLYMIVGLIFWIHAPKTKMKKSGHLNFGFSYGAYRNTWIFIDFRLYLCPNLWDTIVNEVKHQIFDRICYCHFWWTFYVHQN